MSRELHERRQIVEHCLTYPDAEEAYPFDDFNWTILRHPSNGRMFAAVYKHTNDRIWVNLKADPEWAKIWCGTYDSVVPAFHMNKKHWISVILDGGMEDEDVLRLIEDSYHLTRPRRTSRKSQK